MADVLLAGATVPEVCAVTICLAESCRMLQRRLRFQVAVLHAALAEYCSNVQLAAMANRRSYLTTATPVCNFADSADACRNSG